MKANATPKQGKGIEAFRDAHDPARKIEKALASLGPNNYEDEPEFLRMTGLQQMQLGRLREKFQDHVVNTGNNHRQRFAWAGSKKLAEELRKIMSDE